MSDLDDIEGKYGDISGKYGDISGKYGDISGKYGDISGGPNERIERAVLEGRLMDEIACLQIRLRRLEKDLLGIAGAFSARLSEIEQRLSRPTFAPAPKVSAPQAPSTPPTPHS
jgi:hypothetical protein